MVIPWKNQTLTPNALKMVVKMKQSNTPITNQTDRRAEEYISTKNNSVIQTSPNWRKKTSNKLGNVCIAEDHFPTMEEEIHAQLADWNVVHVTKLVALLKAAYQNQNNLQDTRMFVKSAKQSNPFISVTQMMNSFTQLTHQANNWKQSHESRTFPLKSFLMPDHLLSY